MAKMVKETIHANGVDIGIYTQDFENEYLSLTDIARYKSDDPAAVIQNWMRNRDVLEFLGLWEKLHNDDFNPLEFEGFRKQAERMQLLHDLAVQQMRTLNSMEVSELPGIEKK